MVMIDIVLWTAAYIRDRNLEKGKIQKLCRDVLIDTLRKKDTLTEDECRLTLIKLKEAIKSING